MAIQGGFVRVGPPECLCICIFVFLGACDPIFYMVLGHQFCIYRGEVVHLPTDVVHVLFFVNIDGTLTYIYIYMWIYILGSL
jgi:hypothetical protein